MIPTQPRLEIHMRNFMREGIEHHQAGRLEQAEQQYERVLEKDPENPDALHLLGVIAYQRGRHPEAENLITQAMRLAPNRAAYLCNLGLVYQAQGRLQEAVETYQHALALAPGHADGHYNLGLARQAQERLNEAVECYKQAVAVDASHVDAQFHLGQALHLQGLLAEAIRAYERASAMDPAYPGLMGHLADAYREQGDYQKAVALYDRAVGANPRDARALWGMGACFRKQERLDEALATLHRAIAVDPEFVDAHRSLGLTLKELGRLKQACDAFEAALLLLRRPGRNAYGERNTFNRTTRAKLKHDIEQLRYLMDKKILSEDHAEVAAEYAAALARLPADLGDSRQVRLPASVGERFKGCYNRLVNRGDGHGVSVALSGSLNATAIEKDYRRNHPGMTYVDDFLSAEALASLHEFCLESTIWYDFDHPNGYLGAYLEDGFFCPVLLQLATELPDALPGIFKGHKLTQMWAYKYENRSHGIDMHADFAAINVNFWITPDEANLLPRQGGMTVWDKEAPGDWSLDQYNSNEPKYQQAIQDFLRAEDAKAFTIPYRQNRAVIFNSDLFHKTDEVHFKDGYENRRINVTMLYGKRKQT